MDINFNYFFKCILFGFGLAMDACAVAMADSMNNPKLKLRKKILISLVFGIFQGVMPLVGYFIGHSILATIENYIPIFALILLAYLGGDMIAKGIKINKNLNELKEVKLTFFAIVIQAIATSIDALSAGFTIANYTYLMAVVCAAIITLITFIMCLIGISLGKKFGMRFGKNSQIVGGLILIFIGIEIFSSSLT